MWLKSCFLQSAWRHVPLLFTSAEACLTVWPIAQPQGWDRCSVARHRAGLTVCVCDVYLLYDLYSRNWLRQPTCLLSGQSPLEREACIRAKERIGRRKWRDCLCQSVYPAQLYNRCFSDGWYPLNSLFCADVPLRNYSLTHWYPLRGGQPSSRVPHAVGPRA